MFITTKTGWLCIILVVIGSLLGNYGRINIYENFRCCFLFRWWYCKVITADDIYTIDSRIGTKTKYSIFLGYQKMITVISY
jgi:hypothetical protein